MTGLEALMWRMSRSGAGGARFSPTMTLAVFLRAPVRMSALLDRLDRVCAAVPKLTRRPERSTVGSLPPAWTVDPDFAVERHVKVATGTVANLLAGALTSGFPADRPPWTVIIGREPVVVFHLHHSYTDGVGGLALLGALMDNGPDQRRPEPESRRTSTDRSASVGGLSGVAADIRAELTHHAGTLARAVPWAGRTLARSVTSPSSLLEPAAQMATALPAHARAALGPSSPVLGRRSAGAVVAAIDLSLAELRATASRLDLTVNDIFLAGLLDGLSRYHTKRGTSAASLRLGVPISARGADADLMRNQLLAAVLRAPLGRIDFEERARLVHQIVLAARNQPWAGMADDIGDLLARVPGSARLVASVIASLDVLASNVTGPATPVWLAGAEVTKLLPVGPRTGAAINATLLSYCSTVSVGVNIDPAAVPDAEVLIDCLVAAYEDGLNAV